MATHPQSRFLPRYMKALSGAAVVFSLAHAIEAIGLSVSRDGVVHPHLNALLPLSFFELIEALIFLVVGMVMVFIPARVADKYIGQPTAGTANLFCYLGAVAGVTYLPLCAGISTSILPSLDDPSYLQRCLEYLFPMVIAGMTGGYIFGSTRESSAGEAL